jgi:hypothetical protein
LGYKISYFFMQARLKSGKALNRRNELNVTWSENTLTS